MITVTLQLENASQLEQLAQLMKGETNAEANKQLSNALGGSVQSEVPPKPATKAAAKGKKGKPAGTRKSAAPTEEASDEEVTKDDVLEILKKVNTLKGIAVAKDALTKFKAKKVSDLEEDQYAQFVEYCKTQLAQ